MVTPRRLFQVFSFLLLMARPPQAAAIEMEYVTYNGFLPIQNALGKVQMIFANGGYLNLLFFMAVGGVVVGMAVSGIRALRTGQLSILNMLLPIFAGVVLTVAFVIPREGNRLVLYDHVLNTQDVSFNNLPSALVFVAGLLNGIERSLVEIVNDTEIDDNYMDNAGGVGFSLLRDASRANGTMPDANAKRNIKLYITDCVMPDLSKPDAEITAGDLLHSDDLIGIFSNANSPSSFTTFYTDFSVETPTCQEAWSRIMSQYLTSMEPFQEMAEEVCARCGFDKDMESAMEACADILVSMVNRYTGTEYGGPGAEAYVLEQAKMAYILNEALKDTEDLDDAFEVRTSQQTMIGGLGAFSAANEWFPVIRAVLTAVVICMVPFVFLFVATPLFGRALAVFFGLFSFVAIWGIIDALMHSMASSYVFNMLSDLRSAGFGYAALMSYPDAATKALGVFGLVRSSGMVLATLLTGIFVRVGTYELTQLSGTIGSHIRGRAESASVETQTPIGRAHLAGGLVDAGRENMMLFEKSWANRVNARFMPDFRQTELFGGMTSAFRGDARVAGKSMARADLFSEYGRMTQAGEVVDAYSGDVLQAAAFTGVAGGFKGVETARKGENIEALEKTKGILRAEMARRAGDIETARDIGGPLGTHDAMDCRGLSDMGEKVEAMQGLSRIQTHRQLADLKETLSQLDGLGVKIQGLDESRFFDLMARINSGNQAANITLAREMVEITGGDIGNPSQVREMYERIRRAHEGRWGLQGLMWETLAGQMDQENVMNFMKSVVDPEVKREFLSAALRTRIASDLMTQGGPNSGTQDLLKQAVKLPLAEGILGEMLDFRLPLTQGKARELSPWLSSGLGENIKPELLQGQTHIGVGFDMDGNVKPLFVSTQEGYKGDEWWIHQAHEADGSFIKNIIQSPDGELSKVVLAGGMEFDTGLVRRGFAEPGSDILKNILVGAHKAGLKTFSQAKSLIATIGSSIMSGHSTVRSDFSTGASANLGLGMNKFLGTGVSGSAGTTKGMDERARKLMGWMDEVGGYLDEKDVSIHKGKQETPVPGMSPDEFEKRANDLWQEATNQDPGILDTPGSAGEGALNIIGQGTSEYVRASQAAIESVLDGMKNLWGDTK